jgi:hypothetical protein
MVEVVEPAAGLAHRRAFAAIDGAMPSTARISGSGAGLRTALPRADPSRPARRPFTVFHHQSGLISFHLGGDGGATGAATTSSSWRLRNVTPAGMARITRV